MSERTCSKCGAPVAKIDGFWNHYWTKDFEGPCWWGSPEPFQIDPEDSPQET